MTVTPSAFKRVFIGNDATYAGTPEDADLLTIAGNGDIVFKGNFNGGATVKETRMTYNDNGYTAELQIVNDLANANSIAIRNLNADGYSAYVARDDNGVERMAIGVGNSSSAQPDVVYWEASYFTGASHSTPPPEIKIQQTGYMFGSYNQRTRMLFKNDGVIHLVRDNGNAGFVFDSVTSSLAIKPVGATATTGSILDVLGPGLFGDTSISRVNAMTGLPAIGINQSDGMFMRAVYQAVGTFVLKMTGNTTTRALEFVNADNSDLVMMSMKLNGTGQVTFGGPILRSTATALTATGTVQADALALTKELNFVTTAAAGTGVKLPTAIAGMQITVVNRGANTLNVYPETGAQIDALGTNVATTVASNAENVLVASTATQWFIVS